MILTTTSILKRTLSNITSRRTRRTGSPLIVIERRRFIIRTILLQHKSDITVTKTTKKQPILTIRTIMSSSPTTPPNTTTSTTTALPQTSMPQKCTTATTTTTTTTTPQTSTTATTTTTSITQTSTTATSTKEENPTPAKNGSMKAPEGYKYITEGSSHMLLPLVEPENSNKSNQSVFYNPVQIQNRDLSILMISLFQKEFYKEKKMKILDALAASGLRSIRYIKEIPNVESVLINDMEEAAIELAKENIKMNDLTMQQKSSIRVSQGDALDVMYKNRGSPFDVIDLDPYGSAAPFLDAAIQAIADGGMLCVTCTDMAVLSGAHVDACYGRYGSIPMPKGKYCQEYALRIVLYALNAHANVYGKVITPLLSVGMAFYVRLFVRVTVNKAEVLKSGKKVGMVYQSTQCPSFYTVPLVMPNAKNTGLVPSRGIPNNATQLCESTNAPFKISGPIWLDPIHDLPFVQKALQVLEDEPNPDIPTPPFLEHLSTKKQIHGLLTIVSEELPNVPLYYTISDITNTLHCIAPPLRKIYTAIQNAGYEVSAQHKEPTALKTNAPPSIIWAIMRAWIKDNPISKKWLEGKNQNSTAAKILLLNKPEKEEIEVDWLFKGEKKIVKKKAARFPMNPEKYWGPKPRAVGNKRHLNNDTADATTTTADDTTTTISKKEENTEEDQPDTKKLKVDEEESKS